MSHYKAKVDFTLNDTFYEKGDDVEVKTQAQLVKLNELGFIQPVSVKEIKNFGKTKVIKKENKED